MIHRVVNAERPSTGAAAEGRYVWDELTWRKPAFFLHSAKIDLPLPADFEWGLSLSYSVIRSYIGLCVSLFGQQPFGWLCSLHLLKSSKAALCSVCGVRALNSLLMNAQPDPHSPLNPKYLGIPVGLIPFQTNSLT